MKLDQISLNVNVLTDYIDYISMLHNQYGTQNSLRTYSSSGEERYSYDPVVEVHLLQ